MLIIMRRAKGWLEKLVFFLKMYYIVMEIRYGFSCN